MFYNCILVMVAQLCKSYCIIKECKTVHLCYTDYISVKVFSKSVPVDSTGIGYI